MCRIVYVPNSGLVDEQDLLDLFGFLETTMGGDGNGLAFEHNDQVLVTKSVEIHTDDLAYMAANVGGPTLFHTRRATSGGICNELCQPFVVDNMAVAHNGMWRDWDDIAVDLILQGLLPGDRPINDSLAAAVFASKFGRYSLEVISTGVFVLMTPDGAWLHLRGGSFKFCPDLGIYASEFPKDWPASKRIGNDAIAFLSEDGPIFECGGWWQAYVSRLTQIWKDGQWVKKGDVEEALNQFPGSFQGEEEEDPIYQYNFKM